MVRGKFRVTRITQDAWMTDGQRIVQLGAVYKDPASDELKENTMYHKSTPSGTIEMQVDNPEAAKFFELNRVVYVDFSPAPKD
jgi:hypothetical protein